MSTTLIREGVKVSQLTQLSQADPDMQFLVVYQGRNYRMGLGDMLSIVEQPTKEDLGLGNVDNTSDLDKPLSTATIEALDNKANKNHGHSIGAISQLQESLDNKANILHSHQMVDIDGIQEALNTKANQSEITRLEGEISSKSPITHTHEEFPLIQQAIDYLNQYKSDTNHTHSEFTLIEEILARKAEINHSHEEFVQFTQLIADLNDSKANKVHTHNMDSINGLVEILATKATLEQLYLKADKEHRHLVSQIDGLEDIISNLALKDHRHNIASVNGLAEALNSKLSVDTFNQLWNQLPDFIEMNERIDGKLNTEVFLNYSLEIEERLATFITREEFTEVIDNLELTAGNVRFVQNDW